MHETSNLYKSILSSNYSVQTSVVVGNSGNLITEVGDRITFAGTSILIATSGADSGYSESKLISVKTKHRVFSKNTFNVGNCIVGELKLQMRKPLGEIPKQARLSVYSRITDYVRFSEWIPKGVYFIDTRNTEYGSDILEIQAFDCMLKTEQPYPNSKLSWPAKDYEVVAEIAKTIGTTVDKRTIHLLKGYLINYPSDYSCRETLSYIAAMNGGNFVINDFGELQFIPLNSIPKESSLLINEAGFTISFGGVRISV